MTASRNITPRSLAFLTAEKAGVIEYKNGRAVKAYKPSRSLKPKIAEAIMPHFTGKNIIVHHPSELLFLRLTSRHVAKLLMSPRGFIVPEVHVAPPSNLAKSAIGHSLERRKAAGIITHKGRDWKLHLVMRVKPGLEHAILLGLATSPHARLQFWQQERRGGVKSRYGRSTDVPVGVTIH